MYDLTRWCYLKRSEAVTVSVDAEYVLFDFDDNFCRFSGLLMSCHITDNKFVIRNPVPHADNVVRLHCSTSWMRPVATDGAAWSVSLSLGHNHEPCKND